MQVAALQRETDVLWYERHLAGLYPRFAAAPAAQRLQWIREGTERAMRNGLGRRELLQYLSFEQTFHPGCLEDEGFAWARELLSEPDKSPEERMKALRHETIRRLLKVDAESQQHVPEVTLESVPHDGGSLAEATEGTP